MLNIGDLRSIIMLNYLTDPMLEKILAITSVREYKLGEYVFKEGEYADRLFSVLKGRVGLEVAKNPSTFIRLTEITRGMTFGLSSLLDTDRRRYVGYAKSLADSEVLTWKGADLEKLFVEDHEMGYLLMRRVANILNKRFHVANAQLVEVYQ